MTAGDVTRKLQAAGDQLAALGRDALMREAQETVRLAAARAPKEDGELAASAFVRPRPDGAELGFSADHAILQHEDMTLQHDDGEPKFLERSLMERKDSIQAALGAYLRGAVGGR